MAEPKRARQPQREPADLRRRRHRLHDDGSTRRHRLRARHAVARAAHGLLRRVRHPDQRAHPR
eukprot:scaffold24092_cov62-Phaeocystis_antarctica.AAC.3